TRMIGGIFTGTTSNGLLDPVCPLPSSAMSTALVSRSNNVIFPIQTPLVKFPETAGRTLFEDAVLMSAVPAKFVTMEPNASRAVRVALNGWLVNSIAGIVFQAK